MIVAPFALKKVLTLPKMLQMAGQRMFNSSVIVRLKAKTSYM